LAILPKVLITGFPPFPGAPVNPTQWLIDALQPAELSHLCDLRSGVIPVDYDLAGGVLNELAKKHQPDIIINFGLAADSKGIRLERTARNEIAPNRVDNSGKSPEAKTICDGEEALSSGLPLEDIASELIKKNLPVQWSDDAGGYLCNYIFYLGKGGQCPDVKTDRIGFIHVPLLAEERRMNADGQQLITKSDLMSAAIIVIEQSVKAFKNR